MIESGFSATDLYESHPISSETILSHLRSRRGTLQGLLPEDLFPYDQDHLGGLGATETLAAKAGISERSRVVDICAGIGGPARCFAHRHGARVIGIELSVARVRGARDLTHRVGLGAKVRMLVADAANLPLANNSADIVVSQEGLLHVTEKSSALTEAFRILVPGGKLVFTDWVTHRALESADTKLFGRNFAANLFSIGAYAKSVAKAGFTINTIEDLTTEWRADLSRQHPLAEEIWRGGNSTPLYAFQKGFARFSELVTVDVLGGVRFVAERPYGSQGDQYSDVPRKRARF